MQTCQWVVYCRCGTDCGGRWDCDYKAQYRVECGEQFVLTCALHAPAASDQFVDSLRSQVLVRHV